MKNPKSKIRFTKLQQFNTEEMNPKRIVILFLVGALYAVSALAQQEQKPAADDAAAIAKETGKSYRGANQFAFSE